MTEAISHLKKSSDGDVIVWPVTGWITGPMAGTSVLLAIQYAETPAELETNNSKQIQLVLTPQQGLQLAEKLTTLARKVLEDRSHVGKPLN